MINFFRKIRRQLANDNKFQKYFRYALGEILLVVIGILIALQINNLKEKQEQIKLENYYLQRLLKDFQYNLMVADFNIQFSVMQYENAMLLIKSLNEPLSVSDKLQWPYALTRAGWLNHPNYSSNSWEELGSTGNLGLLRNKGLVEQLGLFYSSVKKLIELENEWAEFNIKFRLKANTIMKGELRIEIYNIDKDFLDKGKEPINGIETYISQLRECEGAEGLLSDIYINRESGEGEHQSTKTLIKSIIEQLKQELENRK